MARSSGPPPLPLLLLLLLLSSSRTVPCRNYWGESSDRHAARWLSFSFSSHLIAADAFVPVPPAIGRLRQQSSCRGFGIRAAIDETATAVAVEVVVPQDDMLEVECAGGPGMTVCELPLDEDDLLELAQSEGSDVDLTYFKNLGVLMCITIMWAIQSPLVRYMYNLPHAPPIILANAGSALAALSVVLGTALLGKGDGEDKGIVGMLKNEEAVRGGMELGTYKVLGVGFNLLGISLTLSSQAAFCVQLTTVMVPVAQFFMGVKLQPQIWAACGMALGGVTLLTLDGTAGISDGEIQRILTGDLFCVMAAVFYSFYDVRVNDWSKRAPTTALTLWKTMSQSFLACSGLVALVVLGTEQGQAVLEWLKSVTQEELLIIVGVIAFSGGIANGVATLLQIGAQRVVGPSRAQLIYATNPMWNALISSLFLGEQIRSVGIVGAGLFFAALTLAAITPPATEVTIAPDDSTKSA